MGLDLTPVLTFSCTPERGEMVCHAHRMCAIVVQHCRLHSVLSEMLIPFGDNVFGGPVMRAQTKLSSCEQNVYSRASICAQIMCHLIKAFFLMRIFVV